MADGNVYRLSNQNSNYRIDTTFTTWAAKNGPVTLSDANNLHVFQKPDASYFMTYCGSQAEGQDLFISTDKGATFTAVTKPDASYTCIDASLAPGGRLWTIWNSATGGRVISSDDYGFTWNAASLTTSHTIDHFYNIRANPSNDGYVTVGGDYIASGLGQASLYATVNNGASWTNHKGGSAVQGAYCWWGPGTRLLAIYSASIFSAMHIVSSDNFFSSVTDRKSLGTGSGRTTKVPDDIVMCGGTTLFALCEILTTSANRMLRSTDSGTNWTVFASPSGFNPTSLAYDSSIDTLYCSNGLKTRSLATPSTAANLAASWTTLPDTIESQSYNALGILPPTTGSTGGPPGSGKMALDVFHRRFIERFPKPELFGNERTKIERWR